MNSAVLLHSSSTPPIPSREEVLGIKMHFRGGIIVNSVEFGRMPWWPPALAWCSFADRMIIYDAMREAGDTHALIDIPDGVPLYNESGQFYDPIRFPALDWTNGLTALDHRLPDLVDEVIEQGFKYYMTLDDRMDVSYKLVRLVIQTLSDKQLSYGVIVPGYDGVFYGWEPSTTVIPGWASLARSIRPKVYLGIQFNPGHIPLGGGPNDYHQGGLMDGFDLISGSFNSWGSGSPGAQVWQIMGRCVNPYIWPPDEPANEDSHPPPFYLVDSPRGPRFFCAFETHYPFDWVRVDVSNQSSIDSARSVIESERAYFNKLGCHFVA